MESVRPASRHSNLAKTVKIGHRSEEGRLNEQRSEFFAQKESQIGKERSAEMKNISG